MLKMFNKNISSLKMFQQEKTNYCTLFRRCFYTLSKELYEDKVPYKKLRYYRDICILLYFTRFFLPMYIVHFETNKQIVDIFAQIDPLVSIIRQNVKFYEPFMAVVLFLLASFDFVCQRAFFKVNIHTSTWRWWYEMVVLCQDDYYDSIITHKRMLKSITRKKKEFLVGNYFCCKVAPKFLIDMITQVYVFWNLENVDKNLLFGRRRFRFNKNYLQLSPKVRTRSLRYLVGSDLVNFYLLLLAGNIFKNCLNFLIN